MRRIGEQRGFTIVEVMIATAILLTGVLGTLAMMNTANQRTRTASDRQAATSLARDVLEAVRGLNYRQVESGSIVSELQAAEGLSGNGNTTDWEIARSGISYDVAVEVCALDDPADGRGAREGGGFCSDAVAAASADGSPADYKRVTVTVSWTGGNGRGSVKQSSLATSRGGDDAPAVTGLTMTSPLSTPITSTTTTSASFELTTSIDPDSVVWLVEGTQEGVAFGTGSEFEFQWTLPSLDGAYEVMAQAFDSSAISGETKSLTVVLNRYVPAAPTGFIAGRNGQVVEAEWAANPERDVVGYRVYRSQGTSGSVLACSTTTETSCIDPSPPNSATTTLEYWVVALDNGPAGTPREGAASSRVDVNLANQPPHAPTELSVQATSMGRLELSWTLPSPPDPDTDDTIAFLRIYRGGTTVGDRYDRSGSGIDTSFSDEDPGDGTAEYWITAVDTHLQESTLVGPVSLPPGPTQQPPAEPEVPL